MGVGLVGTELSLPVPHIRLVSFGASQEEIREIEQVTWRYEITCGKGVMSANGANGANPI
jgi:hypothetical protein